MISEVKLMDCMEYMAGFPDGHPSKSQASHGQQQRQPNPRNGQRERIQNKGELKMTPKGKVTVLVTACICATLAIVQFAPNPPVQVSSFASYSDSTWQINDTLFIKHGADTIKLDISKLK